MTGKLEVILLGRVTGYPDIARAVYNRAVLLISFTVAQLIANLEIDWKRRKLPQIDISVREVVSCPSLSGFVAKMSPLGPRIANRNT